MYYIKELGNILLKRVPLNTRTSKANYTNQFGTGNWLVGGSSSAYNTTLDQLGNLVDIKILKVAPEVEYFVSDKFSVSLTLNILKSGANNTVKDLYKDINHSSNGAGITISVKNYFMNINDKTNI